MTDALIDQNTVSSKLACLNTDTVQGTNLVRIKINSTNNGICINETDTISFTMQPVDPRDENFRTCWLFEGTDGNVYPAVANSDGELLVDMT